MELVAVHKVRIRGVLDDEEPVLASDRGQLLTGPLGRNPAQRIAQRGRCVDRSDSARNAQLRESTQIRAIGRCRQRHQLQAAYMGKHFEPGICQCVNRDHVARL